MRRPIRRRLPLRSLALTLGALALTVLACGGEPGAGRLLPGELPFAVRAETVGAFELRFEGTSWADARIRVFHRDRPGEPVFATLPGTAFLEVARGRAEAVAGGVEDRIQERCPDLSIDAVDVELYVLRLSGRFRCTVLDRAFEVFIVPEGRAELRFHLRLADASFNRIALVQARLGEERFRGLGARESLDLTGRRVPVWVSHAAAEAPGLLARLLAGAAPPEPPSPAPVPHLISSAGRGLLLENPEYAVFDLRTADRIRVEVFARELTWRIHAGATPLDLVSLATAAAGRPGRLAEWAHRGPIVVARGGSAELRRQLAALEAAGVAPAAVEIEDWFGEGSLGPDAERYGDARALVAELADRGIRVLVALGVQLPDAGGDSDVEALRGEADAAGYWVSDLEGQPYVRDGSRWLDLSNPDARSWWVDVLHSRVLDFGVAGASLRGGDSLPWDARLAAELPAPAYHNRYAEAGARVARRAFREAENPIEGLLLSDTGFVRSPRHGAVLLAGRAGEPATWARIRSAGLSGFAYAAVDVDGAAPLDRVERALGAAAFAPIFRVRVERFDSAEKRAALARAARLHAAWAGYRAELVRQAGETGAPLVRGLFLHHPGAEGGDTFLVGDQLLVAPAFEEGSERVEVALPAGRWVDAWSGQVHGLPDRATSVTLETPGGRAALLYPEGSPVGHRLEKTLAGGS